MIHLVLELQCAIVCPAQNLLWIRLPNHHLYVILIWELLSLPPELFTELNGIYGGKLVDYVSKNKQENTSATVPHEQTHAYSSRKRRNSFFCGRVPCGSFYIRSWKH